MTDPTVTAVSDVRYERTAHCLMEMMQAYERRVRSECTTPEDLAAEPWRCREFIAAEDALRKGWPAHNEALRARSALADVGECETCKGQRTVQGPAAPGLFNLLGPHYQSLPCPSCADKQPRPAAEAKCKPTLSVEEHCKMFCAWKGGDPCRADDCPRRPAAEDDTCYVCLGSSEACGLSKCPLRGEVESPAAHTAQAFTEDERMALGVGADALNARICGAYDVGNRSLEASLREMQATLRRLASTAERE